MKPPIIFIVGPTAVGKSETALLLAASLKGEIISCDAMQVYREINIASAKPSVDEQKRVPHHCLNLVSVTENFDVVRYRKEALDAIEDILSRDKHPIIVGGSGMYMTVLLDGIFEEPARDEVLRNSLQEELSKNGPHALYTRLQELDPQAASKIHINDAKRIIRALEVVLSTNKPISHLQQQRQGLWGKHPICIFGLEIPREELYKKIEERIDRMFEKGLVEEVKTIWESNLSLTAKTLIGVPEIQGYLKGEYDLDQAKYLMKLHTRHFAKRQMTWFKRDKRIEWMNAGDSIGNVVEKIMGELCQKKSF